VTAVRTAAAVRGIMEGKSLTEIGSEIGVSPQSVSRYLNRPIAQRLLLAELEAAGVTARRMAQKLSQLLDAKRIQLLPDGNGGVEERLVDDNRTQLRATEISIKLYERLNGVGEEENKNKIVEEIERSRENLKNATIEELQIIAVRRRENSAG
jgi:DNA-binding transcriptional regulator LsrR (DeoR family)